MPESISNRHNIRILNHVLYGFLLFIVFLEFVTCRKDEVATKEYPRLSTLEVTRISESGAEFKAHIISGQLAGITEYGFIWDTIPNPNLDFGNKLVMTSALNSDQFVGNVHSSLKKDEIYYMRAYLKTTKFLVLGRVVSFRSLGSEAPVVTDFFPKSGSWNDTIKITGKNFSYQKSLLTVKFGTISGTIISNTDSTIRVVVPAKKNIASVNLSIEIEGNESVGQNQFYYLIPQIITIFPLTATFGDTISISGTDFISKKVLFNDITATVFFASKTLLKVLVPNSLVNKQTTIKIEGPVDYISFILPFSLKDILLKSFTPDTVFTPSAQITIKGENFNPVAANNLVLINGLTAVVLSAGSGELIAVLPDGIILNNSISQFKTADISVSAGELSARFDKKLEVVWRCRWTRLKDFPGDARLLGAGFSIGGKGYAGLGLNFNNSGIYLKDFWEYDPKADLWTKKSDFPGKTRHRESVFVLGNEGYIGLGATTANFSNPSFLNDFYKYAPSTDTWTQVADYPGKPRMLAASFVKDQIAFVGTGHIKYEDLTLPEAAGTITNDMWSFNPLNGQWQSALAYPNSTQIAFGFTVGNSGFIYEAGDIREFKGSSWDYKGLFQGLDNFGNVVSFTIGNSGFLMSDDISSNLMEYNSQTNQARAIFTPDEVHCGYPCVFSINNKAYVICGQQSVVSQNVWEFDPSIPFNP